ncbi:hypothetical protein COV13_03310 [Candidatus Woesearchaeota archaeon CG10_big_fil_rev_8_21_14_0_10_32_9]|nr:MAG: hypothetical protein COV13_03310 [Candidatus Woesearchaeota archaeon CG10_big_fil_rev_8_21_14_0_10_32_9]
MHILAAKIQYLLRKEITEIYLMSAIHTFAESMISLFIPIFLLTKGYSLLSVILYELIHYSAALIFGYYALYFSAKNGVKHSLFLSIPISILFYFLLFRIDFLIGAFGNIATLFILGTLGSISGAYYWMGFHLEFAKFSEAKTESRQVGLVNIISTTVSALGPLFGALIITSSGFDIMFIVVIFLLFFSVTPLFFSKEYHEPFQINIKGFLSSKEMKINAPYLGEGIRDIAAAIFWPLLMYFTLISLDNIGGIYAIANALLVIFTFYLSKKISDINKHSILRAGAYFHSITLGLRVFLKTFFLITVIQSLGAISWAMVDIPFRTIFYTNTKNSGIGKIILNREIYLGIGRLIILVLFIILILSFGVETALIVSIIFGAIATFLMSQLSSIPSKEEENAPKNI